MSGGDSRVVGDAERQRAGTGNHHALDELAGDDFAVHVVGDDLLILDPLTSEVHQIAVDSPIGSDLVDGRADALRDGTTLTISRRRMVALLAAASAAGTVGSLALPTAAAASSIVATSIEMNTTPGDGEVTVSFTET
jgi:hypothetical protein